MMKILMITSMINSLTLYSCKTPISMGMILLIQTFLISLISGMMMYSYWYSYMLFLIMIGSMLILFIYMSSLSSNQKFSFNKNINLINLILLIWMGIILLNSKEFSFNSIESINIFNENNIQEENFMLKLSLNKLYNKPSYQFMMILINYLLLTLFIVVKITKINMGPLRKIN
uniref:NADH-ubiquinone oxidoreductase chain 6 n=1 Tax=Heptamelus sp. TaxID=2821555 RepID=A0A8A6C3P0_9HYME|nr:NADH dehydrogenase subunit 6 [Heptamelus sp.]